jgi:tRNA1Val (adenine37-N6)-methyltransferase
MTSAITCDSICLRGAGIVTVAQPKKGNRFTTDSLLLADFCRIKPRERVLELGAGTGVVSLLLAKKHPSCKIIADEFEPEAYSLLCRNIEENGLTERISPLAHDLKNLRRHLAAGSLDAIVTNPPYTKKGAGRTSPSSSRRIGRQDEEAPLAALMNLQSLLKNRGRFTIIYTAARFAEISSIMIKYGMVPKRARFVHAFVNKPASLVLVEAIKGAASGVEILPPLVIHEEGIGYSEEMRMMYGLGED